jgi:hypothetical protein
MRPLALLVLVACMPHGGADDPGAFRVFYPDARAGAPAAFSIKHGAHVQLKPSAQCHYPDGKDARWTMTGARVVDGELPPGLALEDGAIVGAAKLGGSWQATIVFTGVTCAGKAQPDANLAVAIAVR